MNLTSRLIPVAIVFLASCLSAHSSELKAIAFFTGGQKQVEKSRSRWTLTDWMAQKENRRFQDLWLAKRQPGPWEILVGGDVRRNSENESQKDRRLYFSLHRRHFGIGAERETSPNRWNTMIFWQFFGYHQQGTMMTLQAGRQFPDSGKEAWFTGIQSNLYLARFLGVEGLYRRIFAESGGWNQTEVNAFLELGYIRLYVGRLTQPADTGNSRGYQVGARLYF